MVSSTLAALAGLILSLSGTALAGFSAQSQRNLAIYWGQNSAGQATSQQRLAFYCASSPATIIPLAFLTNLSPPTLNFASSTGVSIESDILTCQSLNKTLLLSLDFVSVQFYNNYCGAPSFSGTA